ncbi:hypothetical protein [Anaeromassilibacillus senegalensis]|uniref:hypothetical protein n=1 Tax=Anaeromassilibacillus senegalensis TaxID=1673717 RepID=UPI0006835761|nr:hypothetical protein [Anaeromassilibacillus senegalensis]
MKETGGVILKGGALAADELEQINRYTRRPFQEEELYTFSVALCDNEIDRDWERFTVGALHQLSSLFLGKTGIFNHNPQTQNQAARIYDCRVEPIPGRKTRAGEGYHRLVAKAYLPCSEKNADLILELESGIKKEVSVGCAVAKAVCSICGADRRKKDCGHKKGESYGEAVCCTVLDEPTDAYEWSFVAVPAQREAGVLKQYGERRNRNLEDILKSLDGEGELVLDFEERSALRREVQRLWEEAACGRQYREDLEKSVVRLCSVAEPGFPVQAMQRAAESMSLEDLKAFEKAFRGKAEQSLPLAPQLAGAQKKESPAENRAFQI